MRKLNVVKPVVEAVQITDATFDDPQPNSEHFPDVIYNQRGRCAYVPTPSGGVRADLGDWIVRDADDQLYVSKGELDPTTNETGLDKSSWHMCGVLAASLSLSIIAGTALYAYYFV